MNEFLITINHDNKALTAFCDAAYIGTQYDNNSHCLVFSRPDNYKEKNMKLYFSTILYQFPEIDLHLENSFIIPSYLTTSTDISLQIAFVEDENKLEHSNKLEFKFRPSASKQTTQIIPPNVQPEQNITNKAFISAACEDNTIQFKNIINEVVETIILPTSNAGVGGVTSHSQLTGRNLDNQHNVSAISGLSSAITTSEEKAIASAKEYSDTLMEKGFVIKPTTKISGFTPNKFLVINSDATAIAEKDMEKSEGCIPVYIGTDQAPINMSELPTGFCGIIGVTTSNSSSNSANYTYTSLTYGIIDRASGKTSFNYQSDLTWYIRSYSITGSVGISTQNLRITDIVRTNTNQTISSTKTFTTMPILKIAPTADDHMVNKHYVDSLFAQLGGVLPI